MAIKKITDDEIKNNSIERLSNRPTAAGRIGLGGLSPTELKAAYDKLPKLAIAKINELIDLINAETSSDGIAAFISTPITDPDNDEVKLTLHDVLTDVLNGDFAKYLALTGLKEPTLEEELRHLEEKAISAYEIALENGFEGTAEEWLDSLRGKDGMSAYEIAVKYGFKGSEEDYANFLSVTQLAANALTKEVTGQIVALKDVSPLRHLIDVSLKSETLPPQTNVTVKCCGKNLLAQTNYVDSTVAGITSTRNSDGSITLNGTNTLTPTNAVADFVILKMATLPPGRYILSGAPPHGNIYTYRLFGIIYRATGDVWYMDSVGEGTPFEIKAGDTIRVNIRIGYQLIAADNLTFYPQIEPGVIFTGYEPYKGTDIITTIADGTRIYSENSNMTIYTENPDVHVNVIYNRDANAVISALAERVLALEKNVLNI